MATFKDFRSSIVPNWCPGCGHFSVLAAMQRAAANVGVEPEDVALLSGIGCSGRVSGYMNAYGFHGIHGRVLPLAQGLKMANRNLTVLAAGGDGDGYAIGMNHTIHAIRRNIDVTYIVMDNQIYGLTKGQTSPRSQMGFKTGSTPAGSIEAPINPLQLAISLGGSFIAQGMSSDLKGLTQLIEAGIKHKGFSLINVFSPCVTYNKVNTYEWFKEKVVNLSDIEGYDPTNRAVAMSTLMEHEGLVNGIVYQNTEVQSYQDLVPGFKDVPLVDQDLQLGKENFEQLLKDFA